MAGMKKWLREVFAGTPPFGIRLPVSVPEARAAPAEPVRQSLPPTINPAPFEHWIRENNRDKRF